MNSQCHTMLPLPEVLSITSLSKTTLFRQIKAGLFPAQVQISARRVAWRASDIFAHLEKLSSKN